MSAAEHKRRQRKEEALQHAAKLERLPYGGLPTRREAGSAPSSGGEMGSAEQEHFETETIGRFGIVTASTALCTASTILVVVPTCPLAGCNPVESGRQFSMDLLKVDRQ